jgi:hypothetical protein
MTVVSGATYRSESGEDLTRLDDEMGYLRFRYRNIWLLVPILRSAVFPLGMLSPVMDLQSAGTCVKPDRGRRC